MRTVSLAVAFILAFVPLAVASVAAAADATAKTTCTASGEASVCALGTVGGPLAGEQAPPTLATNVSIELKATDAAALLAKDAEVRAAISTAIQATPTSTATTPEGVLRVQNDIHKAIDQVLAPVQTTRVYFTDWTVQPDAK